MELVCLVPVGFCVSLCPELLERLDLGSICRVGHADLQFTSRQFYPRADIPDLLPIFLLCFE